jgi:stearoyl-CoA desaturase (delta-9 desaturase)
MGTAPAVIERSHSWNWITISALTIIHLAGVSAFFFRPSLTDIALFFTFYLLTGFGITIGFHRLLSHRGFECSPWLTRLFAFLGTAALQGGPIWWSGLHRKHHAATDRDGDPHSPVLGTFFHSHMGWMLKRAKLSRHAALARDLAEDPYIAWLDRGINAAAPWLLTVGVCYLVGGWTGVVWGGVVRTIWVWHATWCVNSVCHIWGRRPHPTRDKSGNVWWVGLWALGEGWHNNHHAHPRAAIHTHHWWEIDPSAYVLMALERVGLIRNVVRS